MARCWCATDVPTAFVGFLTFCISFQFSYSNNIIPITPDTFYSFVSTSNVRLLHVSHQATKKIELFLSHYKEAAVQLEPYGILLGQVSCYDYPDFEYCKRERTERLLFGFRGTRERLVLPISTLADENAIVASALHLALINSVPIIQTSSELHALEQKCYRKCNIVLAYHNTLGTLEHSLFLKLAWAYQQQHVFALTTSLYASPGAPSSHFSSSLSLHSSRGAPASQLVALWLLQCTSARAQRTNCDASLFRNQFDYRDINKFIQALELPKWIEVKTTYPSTYESFDIHQVLLIYDETSKKRVVQLAEPLGLAFRGSVGVLVCSLDLISLTPLRQHASLFTTPSIAFLPSRNRKYAANVECPPTILNEFENAYDFIIDQLQHEETSQESQEHYALEKAYQALSKIYSHDEQKENGTSSLLLNIKKHVEKQMNNGFKQVCSTEAQFKIILYYLDWDTVSQEMLQLLEILDISYYGFANLFVVSCFIQTDDCIDITRFPTIEMIGPHKSQQYGPMTYKRLIQEMVLFVSPDYTVHWNEKSLYEELRNDNFIFLEEVALLAVTNLEESKKVIKSWNAISKKPFLLIGIQEAADLISTELNCTIPCLGILNLGHRRLKYASVYKNVLTDTRQLSEFLSSSRFPNMEELSPEILPRVRHKLLIISLGAQLLHLTQGELAFCQAICHFSWISRQAPWYDELRYIHAPGESTALIALNLTSSCSYRYHGSLADVTEIASWLQNIISQNISPSVLLDHKEWKPLHPAVNYLKLLEDERYHMDQSIIMDNEDPFIFLEGIEIPEPLNTIF